MSECVRDEHGRRFVQGFGPVKIAAGDRVTVKVKFQVAMIAERLVLPRDVAGVVHVHSLGERLLERPGRDFIIHFHPGCDFRDQSCDCPLNLPVAMGEELPLVVVNESERAIDFLAGVLGRIQ